MFSMFYMVMIQVREKLHLVLAMSTFSPNFHSSLRNFPCILNCCTVDWFTLWPPDALHFVSKSFLKDIQFSEVPVSLCTMTVSPQAELDGCTKVSEFFHTSATELADQAYDTETLFNCVTPATFLELNSLFKTLLQAKRNEVDDIKQRYTVRPPLRLILIINFRLDWTRSKMQHRRSLLCRKNWRPSSLTSQLPARR